MNTHFINLGLFVFWTLLIGRSVYKEHKFFKNAESFNDDYKKGCSEVLERLNNLCEHKRDSVNRLDELTHEIDQMKIQFKAEIERIRRLAIEIEKRVESRRNG